MLNASPAHICFHRFLYQKFLAASSLRLQNHGNVPEVLSGPILERSTSIVTQTRCLSVFLRGATGHQKQALTELGELLTLAEQRYVLPAHLSFAYLGLKDFDTVLDLMERLFGNMTQHCVWCFVFQASMCCTPIRGFKTCSVDWASRHKSSDSGHRHQSLKPQAERDSQMRPLCLASFSASIAAPRAPAVSPFGIT